MKKTPTTTQRFPDPVLALVLIRPPRTVAGSVAWVKPHFASGERGMPPVFSRGSRVATARRRDVATLCLWVSLDELDGVRQDGQDDLEILDCPGRAPRQVDDQG